MERSFKQNKNGMNNNGMTRTGRQKRDNKNGTISDLGFLKGAEI
jgi:hypothetical protein